MKAQRATAAEKKKAQCAITRAKARLRLATKEMLSATERVVDTTTEFVHGIQADLRWQAGVLGGILREIRREGQNVQSALHAGDHGAARQARRVLALYSAQLTEVVNKMFTPQKDKP